MEWISSALDLPFAGTGGEQQAEVAIEHFLIAILDFGIEVVNSRLKLGEGRTRSLAPLQTSRTRPMYVASRTRPR